MPITVAISGGIKSELRDYANYGGIFFPKKDLNQVITMGQRNFLTQLRQLQRLRQLRWLFLEG